MDLTNINYEEATHKSYKDLASAIYNTKEPTETQIKQVKAMCHFYSYGGNLR